MSYCHIRKISGLPDLKRLNGKYNFNLTKFIYFQTIFTTMDITMDITLNHSSMVAGASYLDESDQPDIPSLRALHRDRLQLEKVDTSIPYGYTGNI